MGNWPKNRLGLTQSLPGTSAYPCHSHLFPLLGVCPWACPLSWPACHLFFLPHFANGRYLPLHLRGNRYSYSWNYQMAQILHRHALESGCGGTTCPLEEMSEIKIQSPEEQLFSSGCIPRAWGRSVLGEMSLRLFGWVQSLLWVLLRPHKQPVLNHTLCGPPNLISLVNLFSPSFHLPNLHLERAGNHNITKGGSENHNPSHHSSTTTHVSCRADLPSVISLHRKGS